MHFVSEQRLDDDVVERRFTLGETPGILWTPASVVTPTPLILLGPPPLGLRAAYPRLLTRARNAVAAGHSAVTIELPGSGDRPRNAVVEQAKAELHRALSSNEPVTDDIVDRLILPLLDPAVTDWRATLDAVLTLPDIGGPIGYSGGLISVGVRLAVVEPRIDAAVLFAGSYIPRTIVDEGRRVGIPLHVLLQWDDEGNDRQMALDLFDALGSTQKTLHANMGGHTGVPDYASDEADRFFSRHLR